MSYTIISAILLAVIALSSSTVVPTTERNVLARFYPDFAQLYRPAVLKPSPTQAVQGQLTEHYQYFFTEKEYSHIVEESLTMLYTNVIERTITHHPTPNFEMMGTRYFYRRDPKDDESIEIELVKPEERLFREVRRPTRYLYLPSLDGLAFTGKIPAVPYYEVTFICNSSLPVDPSLYSSVPVDTPVRSSVQTDGSFNPSVLTGVATQSPVLSYIDKSLQWTPRYLLDLPLVGSSKQSEMCAYADIRNDGEQTFTMKAGEFISGDIKLASKPFDHFRTGLPYGTHFGVVVSNYKSDSSVTHPLGEQASATHVYQLPVPTSIVLESHSTKSIKFFETNVTVVPFVHYTSIFSPVNSYGKLLNAYNLTSHNTFIPNGRVLLREQGRFVGQITLPDLAVGETHTMVLGHDADVSYRRHVKVLHGDQHSDSITYYVEYVFENHKPLRDVRLYFTESFSSLKYYQIKNISVSNERNLPDLVSHGTDLRGYVLLPHQRGQKIISYNVIVYKTKPTVNIFDQ